MWWFVISNLFTLSTYCYFQVVRQDERQCVEAVNQLCNGDPSAETEAFLKSLERPLPIKDEIEHGEFLNTVYSCHILRTVRQQNTGVHESNMKYGNKFEKNPDVLGCLTL